MLIPSMAGRLMRVHNNSRLTERASGLPNLGRPPASPVAADSCRGARSLIWLQPYPC